MGGCYSTSSQGAVTSPVHKRPRLKGSKRSKKKAQYTPVNGSGVHHHTDPEISSNGKSVSVEEDLVERMNAGVQHVTKEERGVAPSDSGIESLEFPKEELDPKLMVIGDRSELVISDKALKRETLGNRDYTLCHSCHTNLQRINRGLCKHCGHFHIDPAALLGLVDAESETYCTCGPRQLGKASSCRTHGGRVSPSASAYRLSNLSRGKSHVREERGGEGHHIDAVARRSSVDGAEKRCAGTENAEFIFRDPSATDQCLGEKMEENFECDGAFLLSQINACGEALDFICKCDHHSDSAQDLRGKFSGSELLASAHFDRDQTHVRGSLFELLLCPVRASMSRLPVNGVCLASGKDEEEDYSRPGVSKYENGSESTSDLEFGHRLGAESSDFSEQSSPFRVAAERAMDDISDDTEDVVCPVTVKGRHMVIINASAFNCMLEDLALLKEQLHDLTIVIQDEGPEPIDPLDFSFQMDQ